MAHEPALITRARRHGDAVAVPAGEGGHTYADLVDASARVAGALALRPYGPSGDSAGPRVAYLVEPGFDHVVVQWGIWRAGAIGVPLSPHHPAPEIAYVLRDSGASAVIADPVHHPTLERAMASAGGDGSDESGGADAATGRAPRAVPPLLSTAEVLAASPSAPVAVREDAGALILYTSGTTSRPKGVLLTHANLRAQVESLVTAWEWSERDRILCFLPLHHVHGIVNIMTCALWSGAQCGFLPAFDARAVWERIGRGDLTLFMAVPTVYHRLIGAWRDAPADLRAAWSAGCRRMRLMVSGSAALPLRTLEDWRQISGHTLLERYGMTEIGMALSNPLHGERRPGYVGAPLPGMDVRLVDETGQVVGEDVPGEIEVRGAGVFGGYWNRPEATAAAFRDGWFRTGDLAVVEGGSYRILGRSSVDIIKTGGYKVSALEIENMLLEHPGVRECAVVALPDPEWGERVVAAVVATSEVTAGELRHWARERLAAYKVPREILAVDALPRNAMGKVRKPEVRALFETTEN